MLKVMQNTTTGSHSTTGDDNVWTTLCCYRFRFLNARCEDYLFFRSNALCGNESMLFVVGIIVTSRVVRNGVMKKNCYTRDSQLRRRGFFDVLYQLNTSHRNA